MAQPPLSQAIRRLEEAMGVSLLERNRHYVSLTPAGAVFLREARDLVARNKRAVEAARRVSEGFMSQLTIGFVGSVSYGLLPGILQRFRNQFPDIYVRLKEQTSAEQLEDLRAGNIDLGILRLPLSNATDLDVYVVEQERLIAVLPQGHPCAEIARLDLRALSTDSFINFPADKIPHLHVNVLNACEEAGFSPRVVMEAWQMSSIMSLVSSGFGVALLPEQVRHSHYPGLVFKDLANTSSHLSLKIAVVFRPGTLTQPLRSMLSVFGARL